MIAEPVALTERALHAAQELVTKPVSSNGRTTRVPFALFAPYNESVQLMGEFNNWQLQDMTKDDNGWWHLDLDLPDGEYRYKFHVKSVSPFFAGQWVDVGDPRATRVDAYANEASVIRIVDGQIRQDDYQWQHDDKPLPLDNELVLYELHVGNFSGEEGQSGTFDGVRERLDYLTGLGVNALEFMPLNEYPGDASWGYTPRFPFAPESAYGSTEALKRLIDECHARGVRVILDMVWNHMDSGAPLAHIDHNYWFYEENPDEEGNRFGPKFNYLHWDENLGLNPAREYARACIFHWIDEYHIDGIRFDATYLINNFEVLGWLRDQIKGKVDFKPFILIAEHIPNDPAICPPTGPMDASWHESFYWKMQDLADNNPVNIEELVAVLNPCDEGFQGAVNVVNYTTNHDHERLIRTLGDKGIFGPEAFRRLKLAEGLLLTTPGIPMLWMGSEFGEYEEKTLAARKLHWELLQNPDNAGLFDFVKGLTLLRKTCSALATNSAEIEFLVADQERQVLAFKRWSDRGDGCVAVIVANLSDTFLGEVEVPNWPGDGQWHEWVNNYDVHVEGGVLRDQLAESEIKVYLNQWS